MQVWLRRRGLLCGWGMAMLLIVAACARVVNAPTIALLDRVSREGLASAVIRMREGGRTISLDAAQRAALMADLRRVAQGEIVYGPPRGMVLDRDGDGYCELVTVFDSRFSFQYFANGVVSIRPGEDGVILPSLRLWNIEATDR